MNTEAAAAAAAAAAAGIQRLRRIAALLARTTGRNANNRDNGNVSLKVHVDFESYNSPQLRK